MQFYFNLLLWSHVTYNPCSTLIFYILIPTHFINANFFSCRENDQSIGYGDLDEKIEVEPSSEEQQETDKVYDVFLKLAGEDKEVDWKELKEILDYSMRDELTSGSGVYYKKEQNGVNASSAPLTEMPQTTDENNFLTQLLGLICGHFCKETSLAEVVPKPAQGAPVLATFAELTKSGFSKDICRSLIAMMDTDRSGKLGYDEFKSLWVSLRNWKNAWSLYDMDKSGTFSGFELRNALQSAGYRLNNRVVNVLMHRYGNKNGEVKFDDFIMCGAKAKTMIDTFKAKDKTETDTATFNLQEWLECTLYT